MISNFAK